MIRGTPSAFIVWENLSLSHCWRTVLPGKAFLVGRFFFSLSLKTLTISSPFLIVCKVSAVNPTDSFMGTALYEMKLFVLVSFLPLTRSKTLPDFLTVFLCSLSVESYFGWIYMETYEFHVRRNEKLSVW